MLLPPHYVQSNGKAENVIKTVKRLFTKCSELGQSEFWALLDWSNTPIEGMTPAQHSGFWATVTSVSLLFKPRFATEEDTKLSIV